MTATGQIETCRLHGVSFSRMPGESTSSLVHRYTAWREAHGACVLVEPESAPAAPEGPCSLAELSQADAERQVAEHARCSGCEADFMFTAYVCPDWGDHWHVAHVWQPPAEPEPVKVRVPRRRRPGVEV